jgi:deoxyribodipyrimidine photo-lyase
LAWRAFCRNLLVHAPSICDRPLQPAFNRFPWVEGAVGLRAWQRGRTGYPIVDAGMRELWATGWMHNRVRMIVASFLTKHMRVDWRKGAAWFWDTLVDADLANNVANWQWVAGCGADAAPYYRIFNPVLQGEKFDAAGDYVRSWVPELADVPASVLHAPWRAQRPPTNYPAPIVDHATARAAAFAAYRSLRAEQASAAKLPSRSHGQTRRAPP